MLDWAASDLVYAVVQIIVGLLGPEKTEEILRLTCKDPKILI